jgi:serine phosphatase RsbU (regulator of sigma subunit)
MPDLPARISDPLLLLIQAQRSVAYLVVDDAYDLLQAGGHLAHYGLAGLQCGEPACEQIPFLEGLLPLAETPFLIRSVEMPSGRVADVHFFSDEGTVWTLLLDVTAEYEEARRIQQKAYDMTLLSQREARLIEQLESANRELTRAHSDLASSREALLRTHNRLQRELGDAERYVRSVLPAPVSEPFVVDWRFIPSTELGGDAFGYHWIDDDHFALYVIDVCGHGVGAAFLSVAVADCLRSQALPRTNFCRPAEVLAALNQAYQMDRHDELFCSVWYGVYHRGTGRLRYASAGHPPAIVVGGPSGAPGQVRQLGATGPCVGLSPTGRYRDEACTLRSPARLFVFSDGTFEISRPDGTLLEFSSFMETLTQPIEPGKSELDRLLDFVRHVHGGDLLEDDFTIVRMTI